MVKKGEKKHNTKIAMLSDLLIGTKFYSPEIMNGVGKVLSEYDYIDGVIIDGGLVARVPKYFGKQNQHFMSILDSDVEAKYGKETAEKLKKIHELKVPIQKEINNKTKRIGIDSLEELIEIAQPEIAKINLPSETEFYYIWGEEDYDNVKDLIETRIHELIILKEKKKTVLESELERAEETRNAKHAEIKKKEENINELESKINGNNGNKKSLKSGLVKLEKERKKLVGELEHLNIAYRSYERHLATLEAERNIISRGIRSFTKTWQLSREEYDNIGKTGVLNMALKDYKELLFPMFKGKSLNIVYHLEELLNLNDVSVNVSHNRNAITSNSLLDSSIKKRVAEAKVKNLRGEEVADLDLEGHHAGGLKVYAQKKDQESNDSIFFVQLPPLQDEAELRKARNEWIKTWDTKRFDDPFASGLVISSMKENGVVEVEFYSAELLKDISKGKKIKGKELKIEVISDIHIGAPNELGFMTNYDMIEAIKKYQEKRLPDVVIVAGDAINGQHLEQIIFEYLRENPVRVEAKKKKILKGNSKNKEELINKLEREAEAGQPITSISQQKDALKLKLYEPYWKKILEKGGEMILVSGQHYNKSVRFREDEAKEISNLIDEKYHDRVHVFSGSEFGSGQVNIKGIEIYAIHSPKRSQDEVSGLISHVSKINRKVDLAVGGDYHHPGVGYADGAAYVAAAGLQTWTKYVDQIGKQGGVRGIVNVYMHPETKGYVKFELVFDKALKNILEKEKKSQ